mgnify:CR=1 FL=1
MTTAEPLPIKPPGNFSVVSPSYSEPVNIPVANWIRCLTQVLPDPGIEANTVFGPGGSKVFNNVKLAHDSGCFLWSSNVVHNGRIVVKTKMSCSLILTSTLNESRKHLNLNSYLCIHVCKCNVHCITAKNMVA